MSKIGKAYKVILTSGETLKIDPEEVEKVIMASITGSSVLLKSGWINNPNTVSSIVEDVERRKEYLEKTKYEPEKRGSELPALENIFEGRNLDNKVLKLGK